MTGGGKRPQFLREMAWFFLHLVPWRELTLEISFGEFPPWSKIKSLLLVSGQNCRHHVYMPGMSLKAFGTPSSPQMRRRHSDLSCVFGYKLQTVALLRLPPLSKQTEKTSHSTYHKPPHNWESLWGIPIQDSFIPMISSCLPANHKAEHP